MLPLPDNQKVNAEIHVKGSIVAGGSNSKNTDYVFYYRRTSTVPPLSKANLDAAFQAGPVAKILLATNVRWSQLFNEVRFINDPLDAFVPFSHVNLGNIATDGMEGQCTVYMMLRTGLRGKSYRGAKHFTGLNESDTTQPNDDVLNAGSIALWGAVITAWMTPLVDASGNTWVPTVVSRVLSNLTVSPAVVVSNDVTGIFLNKRIGRMKRREAASVY
jgi:hypothetical protein